MPTIKKPNEHFGVLTYTGNGSSSATRSNTSAVNFTPDFVWIKQRSGTANHNLFDINRVISGDHKRLYSNDPAAEESSDYLGTTNLNGFINGGFTTGNGTNTNNNGSTYVAWNWKAGGASTVNTSGSISSNVSVNTTAGFSIVTYTGSGAAGTVGHGLGVAPKMIILKGRSTTFDWMVYHTSLGNTNYLRLNQTNASAASISAFNNTSPTSTVFSLGDGSLGNQASATQVAYCFAEVEGFSKFGSYTGNGSTNGPFVFTNFLPRFVLIKQSSSAGNNWQLIDIVRETTNPNDTVLFPNVTTVEGTGNATLDFLSNGFKVRTTDGTVNTSTSTYVYAAFAESPFKYSNAR